MVQPFLSFSHNSLRTNDHSLCQQYLQKSLCRWTATLLAKILPVSNRWANGGIRLHEWIFDKKTLADNKLVEEFMNESGAFIVGNRTYSTAIDDWVE